MSMSSELTLEVVYYNEQLAVCEPLIEPVEADIGHRPWQIALSVSVYFIYSNVYYFFYFLFSAVCGGKVQALSVLMGDG